MADSRVFPRHIHQLVTLLGVQQFIISVVFADWRRPPTQLQSDVRPQASRDKLLHSTWYLQTLSSWFGLAQQLTLSVSWSSHRRGSWCHDFRLPNFCPWRSSRIYTWNLCNFFHIWTSLTPYKGRRCNILTHGNPWLGLKGPAPFFTADRHLTNQSHLSVLVADDFWHWTTRLRVYVLL